MRVINSFMQVMESFFSTQMRLSHHQRSSDTDDINTEDYQYLSIYIKQMILRYKREHSHVSESRNHDNRGGIYRDIEISS
jgi:hypothetical protein